MEKDSSLESFLPDGMVGDDFYVILAALAAFFLVWSIGGSLNKNKVEPRLEAIHRRRAELKDAYLKPVEDEITISDKKDKNAPDWMRQVVNKFIAKKDQHSEKLKMKFIQAGYQSNDLTVIYYFGKLIMPFVGLAIGVLLAKIDWSEPFTLKQSGRWFVLILCGYLGATLQDIWIYNKRQKRFSAIRDALPDTLDLMLICAEAGLSLSAALNRVAKELHTAYPQMSEELSYTSVEIGFLPDRSIALRHLAERVDIPEVRGIVNVLQQTEKYGTPIGKALRVLSKEFRDERMLRAEQKAAQLPAIMTIPLIIFILPTLFIIVLTPAILDILSAK